MKEQDAVIAEKFENERAALQKQVVAAKVDGAYRDWASLPKKVLKAIVAAVQQEQGREYALRQKVPNPLAMTQFVMGYAPEADCMTDAARPAPPMPADGLLLFALTCKKWRAFQQTLGPLRQKVGDLMACRKRWLGRISSALELPENRIMRDHVLFTYGQAQGMPVRGPCLPNMPESTFDLMAAGGHESLLHMFAVKIPRLSTQKRGAGGPGEAMPNVRVVGGKVVNFPALDGGVVRNAVQRGHVRLVWMLGSSGAKFDEGAWDCAVNVSRGRAV